MAPVAPVIYGALLVGCASTTAPRKVSDAEHELNGTMPKMVSRGIRLEGINASAENKITFLYTLTTFRLADLQTGERARQISAAVEQDIKRSDKQEARGLYAADLAVTYQYLDRDGELVIEETVAAYYVPSKVKKGSILQEPSSASDRSSR